VSEPLDETKLQKLSLKTGFFASHKHHGLQVLIQGKVYATTDPQLQSPLH
jgi:hypothetical protein